MFQHLQIVQQASVPLLPISDHLLDPLLNIELVSHQQCHISMPPFRILLCRFYSHTHLLDHCQKSPSYFLK